MLAVFPMLPCFAQNPSTADASDILLQLKKLNVLGSVLYIGAHPDDENNALLPYLAKGKLYRTAYLSLTRGDGGQNLLGDEQGVELGLIRTQELLAARKVDGAEQYFSRAYDFGFSKSAAESLRIWGKEKILSDVVWVIRKFQPDIIIKRFPPDKRAGHGHHAASSILADEAFAAAADPKRFPEQFKYGVKPWQAQRILWNTYNFGGNNTTSKDQLKIDIGGYNPLIGKSYGELGAEARTMHKSQGEGRPGRRGESYEYFTTTAGSPAKESLMDGVNTSWQRLQSGAAISSMINDVINNFNSQRPEASVPALIKIYRAIKLLPEGVWKEKKLADTQRLIEECSALFIDATSNQQKVVQGGELNINFNCIKRADVDAKLIGIHINPFDTTCNINLATNQNYYLTKDLPIANDKEISQPYWLKYPLAGGIFDVRNQLLIGKAENDPPFQVNFLIKIDGQNFIIKRAVQYRVTDPVRGDLYEPIVVLPKVELNFVKDNFISINDQPVQIEYHVKSNEKNGNTDEPVILGISNGWEKIDKKVNQSFQNKNGDYEVVEEFKPVSTKTNTTEQITLKTADGKYNGYSKTIAYNHIPTLDYFPNAKANLVKLDIKIVGKKIGYIEGADDKVAASLIAMGYNVETLSEADLTDAKLAGFDAIITGIRAYNLHEYLSDKNDVLMRYVKNGGNLVVQYLKSNQVGQKNIVVGPYPFFINSGSRVTEEDAKVNFLLPNNPALNYPNKIVPSDFDGWVQERSTYQAIRLDPHFEMPLGMHDSGEPQSNGSLAIAKYGKGNFVYASLAFFRQLPAGVPGAYRLMANLIALPKNE